MKRLILLSFLALVAAGCSLASHTSSERVGVAPYDPNCLWHMKVARDYVGQGRYELAKEHYLMALAASDDAETQRMVTHELKSADLMIKAQR